MNLSTWLASTLLAATAALTIGWVFAANLRQHAAWENALRRAVLLLLLVLPVTQALAPRLPGTRWLEQQRAKWSAHWNPASMVSGQREASESQEIGSAPSLHAPTPSLIQATAVSTLVQGLLWIWIVGTSASLCRLALGLKKVWRLLDASEPLPVSAYQPALESCARLANVPPPSVRVVKGLPSPVLVGYLHPCILVPAGGVPPSKEVWLHELAHLRRGDLWWFCLGRVTCALWWFHPLAWMTRRRLERSAENVCDDLVVLWTQDPSAYATQLMAFVPTMLDNEAWSLAGTAMAGYRSELGKRISRMLEPGRKPGVTIGRGGLVSLLAGTVLSLLLLTAICASHGQTAPPVDPTADQPTLPSRQTSEAAHAEAASQITQGRDSDTEAATQENIERLKVLFPPTSPAE